MSNAQGAVASGVNTGVVVGAVIGGIAGAVAIGAAVYYFFFRNKNKEELAA